jgi:hypothetical protein
MKSIQEIARAHTHEAVKALVDALSRPNERVAAATVLLAYGYGRPVQSMQIRVIKSVEDLTDTELRALAGIEQPDDGTRH